MAVASWSELERFLKKESTGEKEAIFILRFSMYCTTGVIYTCYSLVVRSNQNQQQHRVCHFLRELESPGGEQQHDHWWDILGNRSIRIKLKPGQLYANELRCCLATTNRKLKVRRSREHSRTQACKFLTLFKPFLSTMEDNFNRSSRFPHYLNRPYRNIYFRSTMLVFKRKCNLLF